MERRNNMPLWVFLGLLNIETRKGALILTWSCLAISLAFIPLSYYLDDWSWAGMMLAITPWYWLSMKWVDRNSSWELRSSGQTNNG